MIFEHEALHLAAVLAHEVLNRRNRLVVGHGAAIEDIVGGFLAFIFERIEQ
jgi:hypothetical protein